MPICPECRFDFQGKRKDAVFCGTPCKDKFHNREKCLGLRLDPENMAYLRDVAEAMGHGLSQQLNIMVNRQRDPDGQQEDYQAAIFGVKEA